MIKIRIICVGKVKDNYLIEGTKEYLKRLSSYCNVEIIELKDEKIVSNNSESNIKDVESSRILAKINDKEYVFAMDVLGKEVSSEQLAYKLDDLISEGKSNLCFVIGGSLGFNDLVRKRADFLISLSRLTFTHAMARLLLMEQIYRSFKIINNETYHK